MVGPAKKVDSPLPRGRLLRRGKSFILWGGKSDTKRMCVSTRPVATIKRMRMEARPSMARENMSSISPKKRGERGEAQAFLFRKK